MFKTCQNLFENLSTIFQISSVFSEDILKISQRIFRNFSKIAKRFLKTSWTVLEDFSKMFQKSVLRILQLAKNFPNLFFLKLSTSFEKFPNNHEDSSNTFRNYKDFSNRSSKYKTEYDMAT